MVLIQLPASLPWKATRNLHQYWGPCCPWGRAGWSSCLQSLLWPSPNCYSLDSESVDDLSLSPACPLLLFQINTLLKKQTKNTVQCHMRDLYPKSLYTQFTSSDVKNFTIRYFKLYLNVNFYGRNSVLNALVGRMTHS